MITVVSRLKCLVYIFSSDTFCSPFCAWGFFSPAGVFLKKISFITSWSSPSQGRGILLYFTLQFTDPPCSHCRVTPHWVTTRGHSGFGGAISGPVFWPRRRYLKPPSYGGARALSLRGGGALSCMPNKNPCTPASAVSQSVSHFNKFLQLSVTTHFCTYSTSVGFLAS